MSDLPTNTLETSVLALVERLDAKRVDHAGETKLLVPGDRIVDACRLLRNEYGFEHFSGMTGVDYWPRLEPRYHIVYFLHSYRHNLRIELRVPVNDSLPLLPSVVSVYPNANWYEREVWDMFGVRFEGHPDMRRILMPYEWEGHPLRKDYPVGYEEVRFTFNAGDLDRKKPSPKD